VFGSDSGAYSFDVVDPSGSQFSMDMPAYPGNFLDQTYSYAVDGGTIALAFGSITNTATATYQDEQGNEYTAPPVSVTVDITTVGDFNFDGSGQSYNCQLARLWQSTVVAAVLVAGGVAIRYAPNTAARTGGGIGVTVAAAEQIRASREYLNALGCG
jgi:hypothetical protein